MFLLSKKLLVLIVVATLLFGNERRQSTEGLNCWVCEPPLGAMAGNQCTNGSKEYSMEVVTKHPDPVCYILEARNGTTNDVVYLTRYFISGGGDGKDGTCEKRSNPYWNMNYTQCYCTHDDCNKGGINGVGERGGDNGAGGTSLYFGGNGIAVAFLSFVLLVVKKSMI